MSSNFLGIEIGRRALAANQIALETIGQNTANVNTPGYSRQRVILEASHSSGFILPNGAQGQIGTGVDVAGILRMRDQYLDGQARNALSDQGSYETLRDILTRAQGAFNEPSSIGTGSLLTGFLNSFSDLATDPANAGLRAGVRTQAQALVSGLHGFNANLKQVTSDTEKNITLTIHQINDIAKQIASLNGEIQKSVLTGGSPNELLDKRDSLLESLGNLTDTQVIQTKDSASGKFTGSVQVYVGGQPLVYNDESTPLPTSFDTASGSTALLDSDNNPIPIRGGVLSGLLQARTVVEGYRAQLSQFASATITAVNAQHALGMGLDGSTGKPFFVGTDASDIDVASDIKKSTDAIAAGAAPVPPAPFSKGNGDNASAIARIAQQKVINSGTLNQFYNAQVTQVGSDVKHYTDLSDSQQKIISQTRNQQSAVSGVSLDEELTQLIQYQRSYQAASRFISVMDDALDRVINGLGK